jgi:hypothetical protein
MLSRESVNKIKGPRKQKQLLWEVKSLEPTFLPMFGRPVMFVIVTVKPRKDARRGRCHLLEAGLWSLWMTPLPRYPSHQVTK